MATFAFAQVDVFTAVPLRGNPLAVVRDADGLPDARMAAFARWTNLSETTYLLRPTAAGADYRVRIFTPGGELPFAGHPTLGSCHFWLAAGGQPQGPEVVQECGDGLVRVRRDGARLTFAAPVLAEKSIRPPSKPCHLRVPVPAPPLHHQQRPQVTHPRMDFSANTGFGDDDQDALGEKRSGQETVGAKEG